MSDINEIGHGEYGEGVLDEPTTYRPEKGDSDTDLSSTYAAGTDPEELVNGGPRPEHGIMTTTGGNAGPNSFRPKARHGQGIAPTTTGDATTGSMDSPTDGATSDATSSSVD